MSTIFQTVEDVLADDLFLAWYHQESEEKIKAWENWLQANPWALPLVEGAIGFMHRLPAQEKSVSHQQTEARLQQLNERINGPAAPVVNLRSHRRWWMAAAAALLLLAGGYTWLQLTAAKHNIETSYGEICSNKLPDGSTMILNANSDVKLSEGWQDGKDREVWLNGEAYFSVAKTPQKSRFIVHTHNLDVIVTGTQFNVLNRDNRTTVLLKEGSVTIRTADGKELAMKPGDYVETSGGLVERKPAKEENVLAWKENRLAFDNTPITDVAKMITQHYGVEVKIADVSVYEESITGIMPNNNLDDLLKAIELVSNVRIEKKENAIIISRNSK